MTQQQWDVFGVVLLAVIAILLLRWVIGRRVRFRRRMELGTQERAWIQHLGGIRRPERRWHRYRVQSGTQGPALSDFARPPAPEPDQSAEADDE